MNLTSSSHATKHVSQWAGRDIPFVQFSRRLGEQVFVSLDIPGFFAVLTHSLAGLWLHCWEVVPVLTLPKAASHYFTAPGKKPAQSFCASPRGSYLPLPPHSTGRARDRGVCTSPGSRACLAAFLGPGQSYTSLSACSCREKSKSASPCLQGLGAAGIPSLLISPPELFIHSFFTEGYIYVVLLK